MRYKPFNLKSCPPRPRQSGQAIVFLLLTFTVLAFFVLFNVDLHRVIQRKTQAQNAGDAAALATARWQGSTLNLIGELNLLHALALSVSNTAAVHGITNMQNRLNFTGPLAALYAAQVAAKNNRIYVDPALTSFYADHAARIRNYYAEYYPEPWPNAWPEIADILGAICADGIAAGPDNARFLSDPGGGHTLFMKAFYAAVAGSNWCWFHFNQRGLLQAYHSFHNWAPIPELEASDGSEIFGLGLRLDRIPLRFILPPSNPEDTLEQWIDDARLSDQIAGDLSATNVLDSVDEFWCFYKNSDWGEWDAIKVTGEMEFPATGNVRPEYDYAGADAVLRVSATVDRIMPEGRRGRAAPSSTVNWTAAAKPFGYLENGTEKIRPCVPPRFVLPAFRNVRLIPADTASNSDAFSSDIEWMTHLRDHLRPYMQLGTTSGGCPYCDALAKWEVQAFRQSGIDWLSVNSGKCRIPSGGGGRHGGGSRRGH